MSLRYETLRNSRKHAKILDTVNMRCVEGYEPSYEGLKPHNRVIFTRI